MAALGAFPQVVEKAWVTSLEKGLLFPVIAISPAQCRSNLLRERTRPESLDDIIDVSVQSPNPVKPTQ
jgi:hypothetical protein